MNILLIQCSIIVESSMMIFNLWCDLRLVYWTTTSLVAEDSTPTLHLRWCTVRRRKQMCISLGCLTSLLNCFLTLMWDKLQKEIWSSAGVPLRLAEMDKRRASWLVLSAGENNCLLFLVCHSEFLWQLPCVIAMAQWKFHSCYFLFGVIFEL